MKKINHFILGAALGTVILTVSCNDDYDDVAPGNYVDTERIETFPGDTVLVKGTVSNGSKIESVTLTCEAWNIRQVYDRSAYDDKVFNYEYRLIVPADAAFDQTLTVTAACDNGHSTVREIPLTYLPDTDAPAIASTLNSQEGVDFDAATGSGLWAYRYTVTDDRSLSKAEITIPGINYVREFELNGRSALIEGDVIFNTVGSYPVTVSLTDGADNMTQYNIEVQVMLAEVENPIQDYPGMYVVDADEDPADYIDGYYRYMDRVDAYIYQGKFYASTDNAKMLFTPERNLDGDLYGVSPFVSSKLMNNNGYVVPVTIEKAGYYGVYIDLQAHSVSVWPLDIAADACTEDIWVSGTGFTFGDWGAPAEAMTRSGYRYTQTVEMGANYSGDIQYYFYTAGWARVFRADAEGKWWFESASSACVTFKPGYAGPVTVTFDSAHPWATIKKVR